MSIDREWKQRIEVWKKELSNHFYKRLGTFEMLGAVTNEMMHPDCARSMTFHPMPQGTKWGAKWEYGWFTCELAIPSGYEGSKLVLAIDVGPESIVYVNGKMIGAIDREHRYLFPGECGQLPETLEILLECYAGHGVRTSNAGPTPPGRETVPEPPKAQVTVGQSSFGIWDEDAYQLWMDVTTLYDLRNSLDTDSLRVAEIDEGLKDFTLMVDFELTEEEVRKSFEEARQRLKPLLECVNGSTAPTMYMVGHAHLDIAYMWPLEETKRKMARTLSTQLSLMDQCPEYKMLQSQPQLYTYVKEYYPELYGRIKKKVAQGQLVAEGCMWLEADTNITGGESLIRQMLHGLKFFREEFGVENHVLWLPDVFGYSASLPQIIRNCGIKYFATAKILSEFSYGDPFPYNTFTWEGIDGSEVLVHLCRNYSAVPQPSEIILRWKERVQKEGIASRLFPFGYGDGGGGAVRDHLEYIRRMKNLEGVPQCKITHPLEFFEDQVARGVPKARYVGELYLSGHRGTLTSQAKTKKGNRFCEFALRDAEIWSMASNVLSDRRYPVEEMDTLWKKLLLNQFHDILPGTSIQRVHEEAEALYMEVLAECEKITLGSMQDLCRQDTGITIFNTLSWNRRELVQLPEGLHSVTDVKGALLPLQESAGKVYVEVDIPSMGWTTLYPSQETEVFEGKLKASKYGLENELLEIHLNLRGEITSIRDKETGMQIAAGLCNQLCMYKDVPAIKDAWTIESNYELQPVSLGNADCVELVSEGPLFASLRITRKLNKSKMVQEIVLYRNSRRIDFKTTIDWQESHKLLKVAFPVNVYANEGVHEIQFAHIRRPNHKSRPFDADRFEVCNHKWSALMEEDRGAAVLNDSKYGVNISGNSINLTLLKSSLAPDMFADKGVQEFCYSFYSWNGSFAASELIREAHRINCPVRVFEGGAGERSLLQVDSGNIIVEALKMAEDGTGDMILRFYESKRTATCCNLTLNLPYRKVWETNLLEEIIGELAEVNGKIPLQFRPFEIKTLRFERSNLL